MMESIEKLRESSHLDDSKWTLETGEVIHVYGSEPNDPNAVNWGEQWRKIADEIEAEIESRYMELPVDADGVPIRVGDAVAERPYRPNLGEKYGEVACLLFNSDGWSVSDRDPFGQWWHPATLMHVNPRTIEDVLRDLIDGIGSVEFDALTAIGEAADEIRELMEVDR